MRLLIGCLDATLAVKFSDWLEEVHPAVIVACCAEILQECVELGKEVAEVDRSVKIKSLALTILDRVLEHSAAAGKTFEGIFCLVVLMCASCLKTRQTEERGGKRTSGNGQAWSLPSPTGQWEKGENGGNWL